MEASILLLMLVMIYLTHFAGEWNAVQVMLTHFVK